MSSSAPAHTPHGESSVNVRGFFALTIGWVFTLFVCTVLVTFSALTFRLFSRSLVAPTANIWGRTLLQLCGIRLVFDNESTLNGRRARVVIINHPSTLDLIWVGRILPPAAVPVGKKEFLYYPIINLAWWALRFALVDRSSKTKARRSLDRLAEAVRCEALSILMAPEGTRSADGTLQVFKRGAFHLALRAGVPIYPIVVTGAHELWPRHRLCPRSGEIRIRFLDPIETTNWDRRTLTAHVESVRAEMVRALKSMKAGGH